MKKKNNKFWNFLKIAQIMKLYIEVMNFKTF